MERNTSAIEVARKELHRTKAVALTLPQLTAATELALSDGDDVEVLGFSSVLLRQLSVALDTAGVRELVALRVGPALQPRGKLATLIVANLAHPLKSRASRASDCLQAAVKLDAALSSPSPNSSSSSPPPLMVALFSDIVSDSVARRSNLTGIAIMADCIPDDAFPDDLLQRLLADLDEADAATQRCNAIVAVLARRRTGLPPAEAETTMLAPLIPYLGREESVLTMSRYLLPSLFKVYRYAFEPLLALLDEAAASDAYFGPWVTAASYGIGAGYISLDGLPEARLREAVTHADSAIRIMAFELLGLSRAVVEPRVMELIKHALVINTVLPTAGGRTDMLSAVHGFLANMRTLEEMAGRDVGKVKKPDVAARAAATVATSTSFHTWWLDDYLSPSIRACREMPPLRSIFALKLLKLYTDVYGPAVYEKVYTPERVADLVACQCSEFVDTRMTARNLIAQAPLPLAGFESLESAAAQRLLRSARESINHPRKAQADAGRAALCIVFTKLVLPSGEGPSLAFVADTIGLLERHVQKAEVNLARGIVDYPLHGPLSAIVELVRCLDLSTPSAQAAWKPTLHALFALVRRVWAATSKVVALGPEDSETAAHEIARAYDVLDDDDDVEGDHTNLLSGCWRAMREASELLCAIITVPLAAKEQAVWSETEVDAAGHTFLTWLHEIRHRGTFSKIAPALGAVVDAVRARPGMSHLAGRWLDAELATVEEGRLSTLRRSAALPFSFLALVSGDKAQLDRAVDRLLAMAALSSQTSDTTKVHAMNTLKIVLLDAKQARHFPLYLERTLTVSLQAFGSPNWNVRNVGLILFSTLTNRSLSTSRPQDEGGRAALAARQTLPSWSAKYPSLVPYLASYLREARGRGVLSLGEHSPLFPLLIILRSLRWSLDGDALAVSLFPAVEPFLASPEWQVREVASQALASLLSPERALEKAKVTATRVSHNSDDVNLLHGRLLFLRRLVDDVVDWPAVREADRRGVEARLGDALGEWGAVAHPAIPAAILDCVAAYANVADQIEPLGAKATDTREEQRRSLLADAAAAAHAFLYAPRQVGADLLYAASARVIIQSGDVSSLLTPRVPEDAQLLALDAALRTPTLAVLRSVLGLAKAGSNAVRTAALEVLAAWPAGEAGDADGVEKEMAGLYDVALRLASHRCVPLREAALAALGRCVASALSSSSPSPEDLEHLAALVASAADENSSEPSRASALAALTPLAPTLFALPSAPRASLLRSLLLLLEDDDLELRAAAAGVMSAASRERSVDQASAVQLWWTWLGCVLEEEEERERWEDWLWGQVTGPVESVQANGGVLFVDEPPNMFRDPLACAVRAAEVLASLPPRKCGGRSRAEVMAKSEDGEVEVSPIDARWAEAHVQARRMAAVRCALGL